jgi:hypothetical protein
MLLRSTYLFPRPHDEEKSVEGREGKPYIALGGAKPVPKITRAGSVSAAKQQRGLTGCHGEGAKQRGRVPYVSVIWKARAGPSLAGGGSV